MQIIRERIKGRKRVKDLNKKNGITLITLVIIGLILLAVVIFLVTNSKDTNNNANNNDIISNQTIQKNENKGRILHEYIYQVPMKNIYVNIPNYHEMEQAYSELFMVRNSRYIAFTSAISSIAANVKEAHNEAFKEFISNMENYEGGVNGINITKEEITTINDLEVYKFEGTINYGINQIHDGYAIGYSFIMDNIPCEIIGSVCDDSQSEELIKEIRDLVNEMVKTVRSEP